MTDLPPGHPQRTDNPPVPESLMSSRSMWILLLVVAGVIVALIAYSMNDSTSVIDAPTTPEATAPATGEAAPVEPAPAEPAPAEPAPAEPAPGGTDGTAEPNP
jgi:hypothetical protein